jgi:hypothetical protein
MAPRRSLNLIGLAVAACLPGIAAATAETDPGYEWMEGSDQGVASLTYGNPETVEDLLFWLICENKKKTTELTVYDDVTGTKVGQPILIELSAGAAKTSIKGQIATDGMTGYLFPQAKNIKVKPVIEVLKAKGLVTAKAGKLATTLPEKGRAEAVAKFAKACALD